MLRSQVLAASPKPPATHEQTQTSGDHDRIIHIVRRDGHGKGKTKNHDKHDNVGATDPVDDEARDAPHPEPTRVDAAPFAEQVREDGSEVGEGGEDDKGADEGVEGGFGAEEDEAKGGADDAAEDDGVEGDPIALVDAGEEAGKGRGVVAGQGPEDAAGDEVGADAARDEWHKSDDEETDAAGLGARRLAVDFAEGEGEGGVEHGVEVVDGVEDGDHEEEAGEETEEHLEEDGLGESYAGAMGGMFSEERGRWGG